MDVNSADRQIGAPPAFPEDALSFGVDDGEMVADYVTAEGDNCSAALPGDAPPPPARHPLPVYALPFAAAMETYRDISCRQFVLLALVEQEPGQSVSPLAERMGVPKPLITRNAQALAGLGLVKVERDQDDLRLVRISVTPKGRAALLAIVKAQI